jgi:hypothetical protein
MIDFYKYMAREGGDWTGGQVFFGKFSIFDNLKPLGQD